MSSVASEISIFPPARPLPGPRGPSEPAGFDAGPGSFGNLLDNAPAQDAEPRAKRTDAKRASDKPGQPDNAGPIESNQQDAASPDVKPVKDTAPADAETAQAAPAGDAHAAPPAEPATPMPAPQGSQTAPPALPEPAFLIAVQHALGTAPQPVEQNGTAATATESAGATVDTAATPPVVTPEGETKPEAERPLASADATPMLPVTALPAVDPAPAVPTTVAPPDAAAAPVPAETGAQAAQPAAAATAAQAAAAVAATTTSNAKPAKPAIGSEPSKVRPETSAPAATPGDEAPAEAKLQAPPPQPAQQPQARPDETATHLNTGGPRAPAMNADGPDPFARSNDAANAVKSGADLVQNLGLTAPGAHAGPTQSTAAAAAAAAAAPQAPAAPVPVAGLAVEIAAQALAGKNRFEIRLDPPELGRINVRLEIDSDGHVTSRLVVDRVETLDLLRRDAPQLERALQQAGLKTSDNALEFSLRHQASHQERNDDAQNATRLIAPDDGAAAIEAAQHNYGRRLGLGGGIDIRV